jgi:hypothetical protein
MPDADFRLYVKDSEKTVGEVKTEYDPKYYGVKIKKTELLLPNYAK